MTTTVCVRGRTEEITSPQPDAEGIWRATPTGGQRTMYDVYIDAERYATTTDLAAARRCAEERAFIANLLAGDAAACGALALYMPRGEEG